MKISPRFKIQYPMKNHIKDNLYLQTAASHWLNNCYRKD